MAGALALNLPNNQDIIEDRELTVQTALEALVHKLDQSLADELLESGKLKTGLVLLVNGRNVMLLPKRYQTSLKDGDEIMITTVLNGG